MNVKKINGGFPYRRCQVINVEVIMDLATIAIIKPKNISEDRTNGESFMRIL